MSRDNAFAPKSLTGLEYVRELFEPRDNAAVLVRNRGTGQTVQRIARAEVITSPEFQEWLAAQSAAGADVYVGMNPIKEGAYSRTKESIRDIRHVYLDLDRDGDASLEAIRDSPDIPAPNFVLDTSPDKHQVVWKVAGFKPEEAEALLRGLSNQFEGDPAATDSTRVLRLPGFANRKLSEEFIVRARHESKTVHTPRDFTLHEGSPETPRHPGEGQDRPRTMPTDHRSQSERDWAYAKRALARGDNPEEIARRIADYRSEDKDDPNYYARHTVMKAQAELSRQSTAERPTEVDQAQAKEIGFDH
jgi:hypothetical protein